MPKTIKIYNEDCMVGMKRIPDGSVDLIITDPPYLLNQKVQNGMDSSKFTRRFKKHKEDLSFVSQGFDYEKCFNEFLRICKIPNILIFCSNRQVSTTMSFFEKRNLMVTLLVWQKTNPAPLCKDRYIGDVEFIVYVKGKRATFNNGAPFEYKKKVFTSSIVSPKNRLHPTQKNVEHIIRFIEVHSHVGDIILDPFMGSGTTAVACKRLRRRFIGFEINYDYYKAALSRLKDTIK